MLFKSIVPDFAGAILEARRLQSESRRHDAPSPEESARSSIWRPLPGRQHQAFVSRADITGYGGSAGGGKALALDTPIPTPSGWATMGDLEVGDRVFDDLGRPCTVVAASEVFPDHECYELEFDSGDRIVADADHRWVTFTEKDRKALPTRTPEWRRRRRESRASRGTGKRPDLAARNAAVAVAVKPPPSGSVRTTSEIAGTVKVRGDRSNHSIRVSGHLELPEAALPIHPYVLGVWLGDGKSRSGKFYCHREDLETVERIRAMGYDVRHVPSDEIGWTILGLQPDLRRIGVLGDKHIPDCYMRSSAVQRLELLRGLMDSDGDCAEDGGAEFCNTNRRLAEGVLELARSLGIKSTISEGRSMLDGRDCGPKWRVKMTTDVRVFHLDRKASRQNESVRDTQRWHYIVACRRVPTVPTRCIAVDSPGRMYLCGRSMVPTHNTDLMLGLAITEHRKSIIFRREKEQLKDVIQRSKEIIWGGGYEAAKYNSNDKVWRNLPNGGMLEFGAVQFEDDVAKYKGRPHDLICFDEATEFTRMQVRFLLGWLRTPVRGQRCRCVMGFNPPTSKEGRWVIDFFAPWLDRRHPNPAAPGELRWFAMIDGKETEVGSGDPFWHAHRETGKRELIRPMSRTFIPARVQDNPHSIETGYDRVLMNMPEPMRSMLLYGDFTASVSEDPWQVIPTAWVEAAMNRWSPRAANTPPMTSVGVDVAYGGEDFNVIARRHNHWFDELIVLGSGDIRTDDRERYGELLAERVSVSVADGAYCSIDAIGWGAAAAEHLARLGIPTVAVNWSQPSQLYDRSMKFRMLNVRAESYWRLRELLNPENDYMIALPPDDILKQELTEFRYKVVPQGIQIEDKELIRRRLGRSPDRADAVALASLPAPMFLAGGATRAGAGHIDTGSFYAR